MAHQSPKSIVALLAIFLVCGSVAASLYGGVQGLYGVAIGIALSALSLGSLKLLVNAMTPTAESVPKPSSVTAVVMLAKLPLVAILIYLATRLSMPGLYCFLATIGLVYSTVVWRLARAAT